MPDHDGEHRTAPDFDGVCSAWPQERPKVRVNARGVSYVDPAEVLASEAGQRAIRGAVTPSETEPSMEPRCIFYWTESAGSKGGALFCTRAEADGYSRQAQTFGAFFLPRPTWAGA